MLARIEDMTHYNGLSLDKTSEVLLKGGYPAALHSSKNGAAGDPGRAQSGSAPTRMIASQSPKSARRSRHSSKKGEATPPLQNWFMCRSSAVPPRLR
jgi:hypothetical protein